MRTAHNLRVDGFLHRSGDVGRRWPAAALVCALAIGGSAWVSVFGSSDDRHANLTPPERVAILRRSQVWRKTDIPSVNIRRGPTGADAFSPGQTVTCDFVKHKFSGHSPKFQCTRARDDSFKVKFGETNGEVFGEVAATRLLWALGFGADRMYPVRLVCRGCPKDLESEAAAAPGEKVFESAAIERPADGDKIETFPDQGWAWQELDLLEPAAGGAPRAHLDALKLLAVFIQHSDNKSAQQRLVCLDKACERPFMLVQDLGLTFGSVTYWNRGELSSVNFDRWSSTPIWTQERGCVGNLPKSMTGSLQDPVISEEGRRFLASLLAQLSDAQIRDLFDVARFPSRMFPKGEPAASRGSLDEWVRVFKEKRREIADRRCPDPFVLGPVH